MDPMMMIRLAQMLKGKGQGAEGEAKRGLLGLGGLAQPMTNPGMAGMMTPGPMPGTGMGGQEPLGMDGGMPQSDLMARLLALSQRMQQGPEQQPPMMLGARGAQQGGHPMFGGK
jgi:hypothetical protein